MTGARGGDIRRKLAFGFCLLLAFFGFGCTRNYYFGQGFDPSCPPARVMDPPLLGSNAVCDIPTQVEGGEVVAEGEGKTEVLASGPRRRTIISEPRERDDDDRAIVSRPRGSRESWQRPDSEIASGDDGDTTIK